MARYFADYPVGNGRFESVNPMPLVANLKPASAPNFSIREQVRIEMELARSDVIDDDNENDFEMDDEYTIDFSEFEQPEDPEKLKDKDPEPQPDPEPAPDPVQE